MFHFQKRNDYIQLTVIQNYKKRTTGILLDLTYQFSSLSFEFWYHRCTFTMYTLPIKFESVTLTFEIVKCECVCRISNENLSFVPGLISCLYDQFSNKSLLNVVAKTRVFQNCVTNYNLKMQNGLLARQKHAGQKYTFSDQIHKGFV